MYMALFPPEPGQTMTKSGVENVNQNITAGHLYLIQNSFSVPVRITQGRLVSMDPAFEFQTEDGNVVESIASETDRDGNLLLDNVVVIKKNMGTNTGASAGGSRRCKTSGQRKTSGRGKTSGQRKTSKQRKTSGRKQKK